MNTRDFQYILAIAEHHSISNAAASLYVSQPHLSKMLMRIESELGGKLFDRSKVPLQPTYAGERYLDYCRRFVALEQEFNNEFAELFNLLADHLTVGAPPIRGSYLFPLILPEFSAAFPRTNLVIYESSSNNVPDIIANRTTDLGVFAWPVTRDDLEYEKLFDERMLLMVPSDHPLHYKADASSPLAILSENMLPMLEGEKFIAVDTPRSITKQVISYLRQQGVHCSINITTKNNITTYRLCERGMGLAVIMEAAMCNTVFYNNPCFYQIGTVPMVVPWHFAHRKGEFLTPSAQLFLKLLRDHAKEVLLPHKL